MAAAEDQDKDDDDDEEDEDEDTDKDVNGDEFDQDTSQPVDTALAGLKNVLELSRDKVLHKYRALLRSVRTAAADEAAGRPCYPFAV